MPYSLSNAALDPRSWRLRVQSAARYRLDSQTPFIGSCRECCLEDELSLMRQYFPLVPRLGKGEDMSWQNVCKRDWRRDTDLKPTEIVRFTTSMSLFFIGLTLPFFLTSQSLKSF